MTVAQLEHAATVYRDPLPSEDLFDRMEELSRNRRFLIATAAVVRARQEAKGRSDRTMNLLTQASLRQAEVEREIVEVARLIVAENDNAEMITL
jgi:hypothetical protein